MRYCFSRGQWNAADFSQVTSLRTDGRIPFMQEDSWIVNDTMKSRGSKYRYISLLSNEYYNVPLQLDTECCFEEFGAPLIVMSDDVGMTGDRFPVYGHHFEVVAYENGINVWELNGKEKPVKIGYLEFPVEARKSIVLSVKVTRHHLSAELEGHQLEIDVPTLPERLRVGITGCEGVNRFYSFDINCMNV